jgi:hypothetical protein
MLRDTVRERLALPDRRAGIQMPREKIQPLVPRRSVRMANLGPGKTGLDEVETELFECVRIELFQALV